MNIRNCIAELLGTIISLTILFKSKGNIFVMAIGYLAGKLLISDITGGQLNPAVSIARYMNNELSYMNMFGYLLMQIFGGVIAINIAKK